MELLKQFGKLTHFKVVPYSANCPKKIRQIQRDNLPKKIRQIVLESIFGKLSFGKLSLTPISHSEEDEENREFNRNMSERPILIDSNVISIDLQIYDDVGSARSL